MSYLLLGYTNTLMPSSPRKINFSEAWFLIMSVKSDDIYCLKYKSVLDNASDNKPISIKEFCYLNQLETCFIQRTFLKCLPVLGTKPGCVLCPWFRLFLDFQYGYRACNSRSPNALYLDPECLLQGLPCRARAPQTGGSQMDSAHQWRSRFLVKFCPVSLGWMAWLNLHGYFSIGKVIWVSALFCICWEEPI